MDGKNEIANIEITGREFFRIKSLMKRYFNIEDIQKVFYVVKGKSVYEVIINDNKSFRLDMYPIDKTYTIEFYEKRKFYQELAYKYDVKIPKVIGQYKTPDFVYKCSKWIKGKRAGHVWNMPHIFRCAGKEVAKINMIKDPYSDNFLGYNDFSKPNAIWTIKGELYLIDIIIEPKKDVDFSVVKILLKNLEGDKERINWFLRGYAEVRNPYKIKKILEEKKYKW